MRKPRVQVIILWFVAVAFALPLLLYALKGAYVRTNIDDYCYGAILKQYGFLKAQAVSYDEVSFYNGNRYSLTFLMGIATSLPPQALGLFAGLSIGVWGVSIFFVIYQLRETLAIEMKLPEMVILSEALLFLTLYRAPNLTQVLFWVTGLATYLTPLVFNTILLGVLLFCARKKNLSWGWHLLVFLLSLIGGGFSETVAVMEFLWLFVFLLGSLRFGERERRFLLLLVTGLLGSGLSLLLLAFSPSIGTRWLSHTHSSLLTVGWRSIGFGVDFVVDSMKRSYLPALASFAIAFLVSLINGSRLGKPSNAGRAAVLLLLICLFGFMLITISIAPSVYAQSAYPGDRALLPAEYVEVAVIMLLGWLLGQWVNIRVNSLGNAFLLVAILVVALYPLRASKSIADSVRRYQTWQTLWDMRYRQIQQAQKNGIMDLEVYRIDLNPAYDLDDINDIRDNPNSHYNRCAAEYFGLNSITADIYPP